MPRHKQPLFSDLELPFGEEEEVRRVYRLLPHARANGSPDGRQSTLSEKQVEDAIQEEDPSRSVRERVDLLARIGLVKTGSGNPRTAWRTARSDYRSKEKGLYEPMRREIEQRWAAQKHHNYYPEPRRFRHLLVNKSGDQGAWRRPDITLIGGMTLPFLPGKFLDVVTFEVKLWSNRAQRMAAMYEALAHRRRATHSYVLYFLPYDQAMKALDEAAITREALRTGVGVIVATQEDDFATWNELVEPVRHSPDPHRLHEFLLNLATIDSEFRRRLRKWITAEPFLDSPTRARLARVEHKLGLERGVVEDFFQEIPPATDREGFGFKDARPTSKTIANLLKIDEGFADDIRRALESAKLLKTVKGGGMERR